MTTLTYDAIVVGAGIVGAACAEDCAREGMRVAIIDRDVHLPEGTVIGYDPAPG